jgi:NADPH:quinone reductase-like Zn-dependent oxidoreductase
MIKHLPSILMKKPAIPEPDVSGTIVCVGAEVRQWAVGDRVFGTMSAKELLRERRGGLAEYTLVHADNMLSPFS